MRRRPHAQPASTSTRSACGGRATASATQTPLSCGQRAARPARSASRQAARHTRVVRDVGSGGRMRVQPGFHARGMPVLVQIVRRQLQASVLPRPGVQPAAVAGTVDATFRELVERFPHLRPRVLLARPVGRLFRRVHAGGRCRSPRQGRRPRVQALARRRRRDARAHLGNLVVQRRFVPARRAVPAHARAHLQHDACAVDERRAPAAPQIHGRPVLPRAPRPGTASSRQRAAVPV